MMEMLLRTELDSRQARFAQSASRAGDALMAIVDDVLDHANIEAGRLRLEHAPFCLGELVEDTAAILAPAAAAKSIKLLCRVEPQARGWFSGDAVRVRQIAWNLASNAIKFTERGEVRLAARALPGGSGVEIEVFDTGPGMDPATLRRVFDAFTQADDSTARVHGGSGLGLTIARELAELMDGAVTVQSEVGRGSCFVVRLPLAPCEPPVGAAPPAEAPAAQPEAAGQAQQPRVLVVDDHPLNCELVEVMLEGEGWALDFAATGAEALRRCTQQRYDLVLMDCHMPGMDGYEATRRLRQHEQETGAPRTPVIALTGNIAPDAVERCRAAGMDDYLSKPCAREQLVARVRRWLELAV
jgi:CheY-like chemotaxis protein